MRRQRRLASALALGTLWTGLQAAPGMADGYPTLTSPANESWTNDSTPAFAGTCDPVGSTTVTVRVYQGRDKSGTEEPIRTTCNQGSFSVDATSELADGWHSAEAEQQDAVGTPRYSAVVNFGVDTDPPGASIRTYSAIGGQAAVLTFDEDVKGVSGDLNHGSIQLEARYPTEGIAATLTCTNTDNQAVSCSAGPARYVTVKPTRPLVPGRVHRIHVNRSSADPKATDLAGNEVPGSFAQFRAEHEQQESSAAAAWSSGWGTVSDSHVSGGKYRRSRTAGAWVTLRFSGTGVFWLTITGPDQGKAQVYIDGESKGTVDNYSARRVYGVKRSYGSLKNAAHTLKIKVLGKRNSRSSNTYVALDRWVARLPSPFGGLGTWVDLWDYNEGTADADIASRVQGMHDRGVRTLYVQTVTYCDPEPRFSCRPDPDDRTTRYRHSSRLRRWVTEAHAKGMRVVGWYLPTYNSPQYRDREVFRIAAIAQFERTSGQGFDGLAIDIEHCGTASAKDCMAGVSWQMGQVRRRVGPGFPIGAITLPQKDIDVSRPEWGGLSWRDIGKYADAVLPMSYWTPRRERCKSDSSFCAGPFTAYNVREARRRTGRPVHVIGGLGEDATAAEVRAFVSAAKDEGAIGCGLYDYATTKLEHWQPLRACNSL
ncbi:MAG: hypothetical protein HY775_11455 [Acidobacteria bacterium]|nr:hypothetical protein [Acidobacteriota bacterium]